MPFIAIVFLQLGDAGMNIITKMSLNTGMSHYTLAVYRHAFSFALFAPLAIIFERNVRPQMTWGTFTKLFILGILGPVIDQNLYYAGMKLTTASLASAIFNMLPAMTFVMAVLCRTEAFDIRQAPCIAKVIGTGLSVLGAMIMTFYKGIIFHIFESKSLIPSKATTNPDSSGKEWLKGSGFLVLATLAWASFFILKAYTQRTYNAPLSLTASVCFLGTLQASVVTLVMEHNRPHAWNIDWTISLVAAAYSGIISSGIAYYVQGIILEKRGPVFVTAFSPLMLIFVVIIGSFILAEKIYLGGIIGSALIVIGLYLVVWGKSKETRKKEAQVEVQVTVEVDTQVPEYDFDGQVDTQEPEYDFDGQVVAELEPPQDDLEGQAVMDTFLDNFVENLFSW